MDSSGVPWSVIGPLATLIGAVIGIGVGWGSMKSIVASLKVEVVAFKTIAESVTAKVIALETNETHSRKSIDNLTSRVGDLEVEVAALKAKSPRNRK